jgi:dTDP-4-amino-4,6-dideoxygalactose transaminase
MTSASLGLLAGNLAAVGSEAERRRGTAAHYADEANAAGSVTMPRLPAPGIAGYLRFPVVAPSAAAAARLVGSGARWGLAPGYPSSLQDLAGFSRRRVAGGAELPGARLLAERLVTLPTHGGVGPADRVSVVELLGALTQLA